MTYTHPRKRCSLSWPTLPPCSQTLTLLCTSASYRRTFERHVRTRHENLIIERGVSATMHNLGHIKLSQPLVIVSVKITFRCHPNHVHDKQSTIPLTPQIQLYPPKSILTRQSTSTPNKIKKQEGGAFIPASANVCACTDRPARLQITPSGRAASDAHLITA